MAGRDIVEHPGGVGIAAITDNNELLMVKQFRAGPKKVLLEIPAGKLEKGEDPKVCGMRELAEETGYTSSEFFKVAETYSSPGFTDELIHIYVARGLRPTQGAPDEDEFLKIEKIPISELKEMVDRCEICDAKSVIAILMSEKYMYREE
ncbi:MAG: NUDIX hydrolase [Clostridia bacterium]|nr:NUDIX hydrolase [Clostridia bacterium]